MIDVIIPARNEETTIGDVLSAFMQTPLIHRITVVIDPETKDATEEAAMGTLRSHHPNNLVVISPESGKGQCVKYGMSFSDADRLMFCDADYLNLTHWDIEKLTIAYSGMIIGVPRIPSNYPPERIWAWPWVSGFRIVPREVVDNLELHGYLMEVQINQAAYDHCISPPMLLYMHRLHSLYNMTSKRVKEMERDREWGLKHGVFKDIAPDLYSPGK